MNCRICAMSGQDHSVAARCRYCGLSLCSEHVGQQLAAQRRGPGQGCQHVFIAYGWLASAIARPVAAAHA